MSLSIHRLAAAPSTAVLTSELRQGVSAKLELWHNDTFQARWSEPRLGTPMSAFQRAPERPR